MATNTEIRRAIAKRAIDRAAARGVPIDKDPAVAALLEEWIRGEIDMKTMRAAILIYSRFRKPSAGAVLHERTNDRPPTRPERRQASTSHLFGRLVWIGHHR